LADLTATNGTLSDIAELTVLPAPASRPPTARTATTPTATTAPVPLAETGSPLAGLSDLAALCLLVGAGLLALARTRRPRRR
jgi:hypothetical protein